MVIAIALLAGMNGRAGVLPDTIRVDPTAMLVADSIMRDSTLLVGDSLVGDSLRAAGDTLQFKGNKFQLGWHPDSKRAMWLGLVLPGGGQIYNRKFWKLPIFYGGVLGCVYAVTWNGQMLRDYSQAYQDLTDDDPTTRSYEEMLPPGYDVASHQDRLTTLFKNKKDFYRRYRDLSIFCIVAVYALSVIDAYIDAELSTFDISRSLSLHVEPTFIRGGYASTYMGSPGISFSMTY